MEKLKTTSTLKTIIAGILILVAILIFADKYTNLSLIVRAVMLFSGGLIFFIDANK